MTPEQIALALILIPGTIILFVPGIRIEFKRRK